MRHVRTHAIAAALLAAALAASAPLASAGFVSDWRASSGLFPDQISPAYTLFDEASPENPILSGGVLTLGSSPNSERMFYIQLEPLVDTSQPFYLEAKVKLVSGSSSDPSRGPINFLLTTAPGVGNTLHIDTDVVFFNSSANTRGPSAVVQTDDAFHTYRIDYNGAGTFTLRYDTNPVPILSASTFADLAFNGSQKRLSFGEGSILAQGTSQWEYVQHNALAVPEPESFALLLAGLALVVFAARRQRARAAS
jgi:hypothetical protein